MEMGARYNDRPLIVRIRPTFNGVHTTALASVSDGTHIKAVEIPV